MTAFSVVHDYGFGITCDARVATSIVQHRSGAEVKSERDMDAAYRFGAYTYAVRYTAQGKKVTIRSAIPSLEAMQHHCLFDEPGMPPFQICTERYFALLTAQGQTGITSSCEELLWFLTVPGSELPVWVKECASVEAAQDWIYRQILPSVMVASVYRPYVGIIPDPKPGCLIQAVQPGYFSAGEIGQALTDHLLIANSTEKA